MKVKIQPSKAGLIVRNHQRNFRALSENGEAVTWDATWSRRERDGDVVRVKPEVKPAPEAPKADQKQKPEGDAPKPKKEG